jgi:tetratricopeptide (TPR) repeat protein/tRNA A-37 threonylcarbamoyl transferase component Bud32
MDSIANEPETNGQQAQENNNAGGGNSVGAYEILEAIGSGGMGSVFRVRHKGAGNVLALKILRSELAADPINVKRFQQELKTTCLLTHPNILPIYDSGVADDGRPYFVMEYLDGLNLEEILKEEGYLDLEKFFNVFTQVCDALQHSHEKRVIHRDLKPSNIMISTTDTGFELVKLLDFGVARVFQQASKDGVRLTQLGEILGSPAYMSPEQCLNQKLDERSDVYSLGVVMYEALAGVPPFSGDSAAQIIMAHLQEKPKAITKLRPDFSIPPELETLVFTCLEKEAPLRYQTAQSVGEELKRISQSVRSRSLRELVDRWVRRGKNRAYRTWRGLAETRRRWAAPAAAAAVAVGAIGVGYNVWLDHQEYKTVADRAEFAMFKGQRAEGIADWRTALLLAQKSGIAPVELARLYEQAGDGMLTSIQKCVMVSHPYGAFQFVVEQHNENNGQIDLPRRQAAESFYKRALALYEDISGAKNDRGRIMDKLVTCAYAGDDLQAKESYLKERIAFDESFVGSPSNYQAYLALAQVLEQSNRTDEAEALLKKAVRMEQMQENTPYACNVGEQLASLYEREGKWALAEAMRRDEIASMRTQTLNGGDNRYQIREALGKLAECLAKQGKRQQADAVFAGARKLIDRPAAEANEEVSEQISAAISTAALQTGSGPPAPQLNGDMSAITPQMAAEMSAAGQHVTIRSVKRLKPLVIRD